MTYSPATWKDWRDAWHAETGLPFVSLGLQHFSPQGGGYHEGNDLLAQGNRLNTDYSKRESDRDRPGTDGSSAGDIGWFDVTIQKADGTWRRVTLIDFNYWLIAQLNANAPDVRWIREVIYTLDRKTVKRWDRLGIRVSGDDSHLSHTHESGFRDEEATNKAAHVQRFWREMRGITGGDMTTAEEEARNQWGWHQMENMTPTVEGGPVKGRPFLHAVWIKSIMDNQNLILANQAESKTREVATLAALSELQAMLSTAGGDIDVAAVVNAVNAAASDTKTAVLEELGDSQAQVRAAAEAFLAALQDVEAQAAAQGVVLGQTEATEEGVK